MKKDWVVWLGCFLLFGAGALWAKVPINTDFFGVPNIHDFFEILSSIATVIAVFFAIGAWQRQVSGQADLELARRVAVEALRLKEAALEAWVDAKFSVNQCPFGLNSLPGDLIEQISKSMDGRVQKRELLRVDFCAALQEARAIWGKDFSSKYNELLHLFSVCNNCAKAFVSWTDKAENINSKQRHTKTIHEAGSFLDGKGLLHAEGRMEKAINLMTMSADSALEKKMLRAS